MRTKHLLMAIATLLVAGCSQNEITEVRTVGNPAVGFDVYTGVATRGTDVSTTTMQGTCDETHYGGFGIMGYYTGSKNWDEAKGTVTPSPPIRVPRKNPNPQRCIHSWVRERIFYFRQHKYHT